MLFPSVTSLPQPLLNPSSLSPFNMPQLHWLLCMDPPHLVLSKTAYPERCSFHPQHRLHVLQVVLHIFYTPTSPGLIRNLVFPFPQKHSVCSEKLTPPRTSITEVCGCCASASALLIVLHGIFPLFPSQKILSEEAEMMMFVVSVLLCLCSHYPGLCLFPDVSQVG